MRIVALEEAFWSDQLQTAGSFVGLGLPVRANALEDYRRKLTDFANYRLPEMDRFGIDVQVLSLTAPGIQMQPDTTVAVDDARVANDILADVTRRFPGRFAGLAALPLQDPEHAAKELRRAIEDLGLLGALVNDHTLGHRLDEDQYAVVWAELESLQVPLYIHPGAPQPWSVLDGYPELSFASLGWASVTGAHVMRLIYGGVFDRFPRATVILGHMGEFLPFQLTRFDARHPSLKLRRQLNRLPSQYFGDNIKITTSGVYSHAALHAAIDAIGINNVMFAVDYPYESTERAVEFLTTAPLVPDDLARVAHRNADQLLRLQANTTTNRTGTRTG
jgi:2,3-dihydroxybenzoate decarboxylase